MRSYLNPRAEVAAALAHLPVSPLPRLAGAVRALAALLDELEQQALAHGPVRKSTSPTPPRRRAGSTFDLCTATDACATSTSSFRRRECGSVHTSRASRSARGSPALRPADRPSTRSRAFFPKSCALTRLNKTASSSSVSLSPRSHRRSFLFAAVVSTRSQPVHLLRVKSFGCFFRCASNGARQSYVALTQSRQRKPSSRAMVGTPHSGQEIVGSVLRPACASNSARETCTAICLCCEAPRPYTRQDCPVLGAALRTALNGVKETRCRPNVGAQEPCPGNNS